MIINRALQLADAKFFICQVWMLNSRQQDKFLNFWFRKEGEK
jgi:hypothetical protein